jgi:hypothetical protein
MAHVCGVGQSLRQQIRDGHAALPIRAEAGAAPTVVGASLSLRDVDMHARRLGGPEPAGYHGNVGN